MQCKAFIGNLPSETLADYNAWAKNKVIARDVIIHSHVVKSELTDNQTVLILVFFDERMHQDWM